MSRRRRVIRAAGAAAAIAATEGLITRAQRRRRSELLAQGGVPFGSLRSPGRIVLADDGVGIHVEVDEVHHVHETSAQSAERSPAGPGPELTVVFVHGFSLNSDAWHFQRAAFRGLVRTVFYDFRSHGQSERVRGTDSSLARHGRDLKAVIDSVAPHGNVVVVGHSMGGMAALSMVDEFPEMIGTTVVGMGLVSATSESLSLGTILLPGLPHLLSRAITGAAFAAVAKYPRQTDALRRPGRRLVAMIAEPYFFGGKVPASYSDFVNGMMDRTPAEVVAEFLPAVGEFEVGSQIASLGTIPTSVICGTADTVIPLAHSETLHSMIEGSTYVECPGAGHMVMVERHDQVNAALDQLFSAARVALQ